MNSCRTQTIHIFVGGTPLQPQHPVSRTEAVAAVAAVIEGAVQPHRSRHRVEGTWTHSDPSFMETVGQLGSNP